MQLVADSVSCDLVTYNLRPNYVETFSVWRLMWRQWRSRDFLAICSYKSGSGSKTQDQRQKTKKCDSIVSNPFETSARFHPSIPANKVAWDIYFYIKSSVGR